MRHEISKDLLVSFQVEGIPKFSIDPDYNIFVATDDVDIQRAADLLSEFLCRQMIPASEWGRHLFCQPLPGDEDT
jgi:hypothetical protein